MDYYEGDYSDSKYVFPTHIAMATLKNLDEEQDGANKIKNEIEKRKFLRLMIRIVTLVYQAYLFVVVYLRNEGLTKYDI